MTDDAKLVVDKITAFLQYIGIAFAFQPITGEGFMPGIALNDGVIIIDMEQLKYPGDILHEAGHIATLLPEERLASGKLPDTPDSLGNEITAQAWSYAACVAIGLDPSVVFHDDGYRGSAQKLIEIFSSDHPIALPTLQWMGMTYDKKNAEKLNTLAYPHMICWVRKA